MATVIFIKEGRQNRSAMRTVIAYCQQEYKTFDGKSKRRLVSGVNCDGENAYREFMATKKVYGKETTAYFSIITRNRSRRLKSLRPNRRTKSLLNLRKRLGLVMRF